MSDPVLIRSPAAGSDPVLIRQLAPGDLAFVFSCVLRELRDADGGALLDDEWYPAHRAYLERVLADSKTVALVAAAADAPSEILAFVIAEPHEVLHWVQVKRPFRGQGLARRLLTQAECPPGTPAAWATSDSRRRLQNPPRGRRIRSRSSTASKSTNSGH